MEANDLLNIFTKGIVADLDPAMVAQNQWVFPTMNIRVMNKEGQGVIVTVVDGNSYEFMLSTGFFAMGACEYNGIAYIVSYNDNTKKGEVGCFPSPMQIDSVYTNPHTSTPPPQPPTFQRKYRPFLNYVPAPSTPLDPINDSRWYFRTPLFNFDLDHQVSVFCKESYDGSVDLYLCDYKNPNRVINSGFTQEGDYLDRLYWDNDFYSNINQIQVSGTVLNKTLHDIDPSGQLLCGIYFAHFRYSDANYNETAFISESNACQVYQGNINTLSTIQGGEATKDSGKKITFNLWNVDTTYAYIHVVITRFYSNVQGVMVHDSFLVDYDYAISSTMTITIDGNETWIPFDEAELLKPQGSDVCCRDHLQINNRYYGGNWKSSAKHNKALVDFAVQIKIGYDDLMTKDAGMMNASGPGGLTPNSLGQYTDYQFTYNDVGHFRGEPYAYSVMYELLDGSFTDCYPCTGVDDSNPLFPIQHNVEGIYRFPTQEYSQAFVNDKIHILGVKMDMVTAIAWLAGGGPPNEIAWFKANVRSMYFMRADRKAKLITQGIAMNVCWPYINAQNNSLQLTFNCTNSYAGGTHMLGQFQNEISNNDFIDNHYYGQLADNFVDAWYVTDWWGAIYSNGETNVHFHYSDKWFPFYRGYAPMMYVKESNNHYRYYQSRWFLEKNKYAFYSPDNLFNSSPNISDYNFIKRVGKTIPFGGTGNWGHIMTQTGGTFSDLRPEVNVAEMSGSLVTNIPRAIGKLKAGAGNAYIVGNPITNFPTNDANGYCNEFTDKEDTNNIGVWMDKHPSGNRQQWSNRNVLSAPYIALELDPATSDDPPGNIDYNLDIVNIYNDNVDTSYNIVTHYGSLQNLMYSKISEAIKIDVNDLITFGLQNTYVLYKGDCFLQKFYFKQLSWDHSDFQGNTGNTLGIGVTDTMGDPFYSAGPVWDEPGGSSTNDDKIRYAHGLIMGIVIECNINPAMRNIDSSGTNLATFYPKTSLGNNWAYYPKYHQGDEAFMYNYGYHRQLSLQQWIHYNPNITYQVTIHKTRIRHTPLNIPYALTDAYRVLNPGDFKDYDLQYGQIMALLNIHSKLVSVQENTISEHFFDQSQLKTPSTPGDLVLGLGPVLSQSARNLATFGSQHQWSVNKRGFGVDWKRRVIWGCGISASDTGETYATVTNLSKNFLIEKWLFELFDQWDKYTDIMNVFPDTPVKGIGIVTGWDEKYREVIFTFLIKILSGWVYDMNSVSSALLTLIQNNDGWPWFESLTPVIYVPGTTYQPGQLVYDATNGIMYYITQTTVNLNKEYYVHAQPVYKDISKSLVYNLDVGAFIGEYSFTPNFYININDDMFTQSRFDIHTNLTDKFWRHNNNTPALFYAIQQKGIISYIVNGGVKYKDYVKIFTNLAIESSANPFSRILYHTQFQESIHNGDTIDDFQTVEFWRNPEYNEHKWELPVNVQTSAQDNNFETESEMRGHWMKVTIEYFKNVPQYIKKTINKFIISKHI